MRDKIKAINKVKFYLSQSGLSQKAINQTLNKYQTSLNLWFNEYLITGSHLTPENFANELIQCEEMKLLVAW